MFKIALAAVLACVLSTFVASDAFAQALDVSPVKMSLAPGQTTTTLRVTNRGSTTASLQIRPFKWQQEEGEEQLVATSDLLVSPPIMKVAAGESQIVRVVLRRPAAAGEEAYRLLLDQLPSEDGGAGINVLLRISMPLFVLPAADTAPMPVWEVRDPSTGNAELRVANIGSRHVEFSNLGLKVGGEIVPLAGGRHLYVLPGAERRLDVGTELAGLKAGTPVSIVSIGNEGKEIATAVVQAD